MQVPSRLAGLASAHRPVSRRPLVAPVVRAACLARRHQVRSLGRGDPRRRNGSALQYSWLGSHGQRGAWQTTVHGISEESDTTSQLSNSTLLPSSLSTPFFSSLQLPSSEGHPVPARAPNFMTESEFTVGQCVVGREKVLRFTVLFVAENPRCTRAQIDWECEQEGKGSGAS